MSSTRSKPVAGVRENGHTNKGGLEVTLRLDAEQVEAIAQRAAAILAESAPAESSPWVDAAGAAAHMAATRDRVYDLVQLGKLEPRRDGRRLLFRIADLDAYLESAG